MSTDGEYDIECESVHSAHSQDVKRVVWHPTEDILISASYDDTVKIYRNDPNDGDWACTGTLEGHESTVWSVDFDSTGDRIVSVSDDRSVRIWTKLKGKDRWSCVSKLEGYHQRPIYDVSWSKTNGLIATACGDDHIRIFKEISAVNDLERNVFELACTVKAHSSDVNRVQWNPKVPGILASCSDDSCVKIWKWIDM
jgi:WD40 repeat protein